MLQLPCFLAFRIRLRRDSLVTVSMMASASAMSPATWPVSPGLANPTAVVSETGSAFCLAPCGWRPGGELGMAVGLIAGNKPDALPALISELEPISELEMPLRFGMVPSGSVVADAEPLAGDLAGEAEAAAVTATLTAAEGGVHFTEVAMLAVAVSFTAVTEVAPDATGICASRSAGCLPDTELTVQLAIPPPLAQPLVNVGFWLEGWATRATDTFAAEPLFSVETRTV